MSYRARLFVQSLVTVLVVLPLAHLLGGSASFARLFLASGIAVAVVGGVSAVLARRHTRTLNRLRDAARALAAGDLSTPPALASPGELGEVADALRRVAEQLGARIGALQAEDALLSALIESLNEGVLAVNGRQQVVRVNRSGREILRLGDAPLPLSLDSLPREASLHRAIHGALRGSSTGPLEVEIGARRLALTATPLSEGGAVIALFDLTELRRLEQIRRDFVANVSHELRTPLTVVSGFAETLAEDDPPVEQRQQFAQAIVTHTLRMQRIVDDLLDLSRMESGGWVPKPEEIDLAPIIREAVTAAQPIASGKALVLRAELPADGLRAMADRTAIRQILTNLIENSLRHTDAGEVVVLAVSDRGGARLSVRDTGTGIAADHLPRIFERFYRADAARARQSGGTGLGLAIVKHLAEAHGGSVAAESEPGHGTTISVYLPAATVQQQRPGGLGPTP